MKWFIAFFIAFVFVSLPTAIASVNDDPVALMQGPLSGAHQGTVYSLAINNTRVGFEKAIEAGADILETDLQTTKDGQVIIAHDRDLKGRGKCSGLIEDRTWEEIKNCRTSGGHPIMTFEELIELARGQVILNVEFKTREVIAPAIETVTANNAVGFVYFQTKSDPLRYEMARALSRDVYLLFKADDMKDLDWALSLNDDRLRVIELEKNMVKPEVLRRIREAGKLSTTNSWRYVWHKEVLGAACTKVYKKGIDIAINNNAYSCSRQRDAFKK